MDSADVLDRVFADELSNRSDLSRASCIFGEGEREREGVFWMDYRNMKGGGKVKNYGGVRKTCKSNSNLCNITPKCEIIQYSESNTTCYFLQLF